MDLPLKLFNQTARECRTGLDAQRSISKSRNSRQSAESHFSTHYPNTSVSALTWTRSKHLSGSSPDLLLMFDIFSYFIIFIYFLCLRTFEFPQNAVLSLLTQHLKPSSCWKIWWLLLKKKKKYIGYTWRKDTYVWCHSLNRWART